MSKIEINEIPMDRKLTGYLWMSNEREPRVLEDCSIEQSNTQHGANPALFQTGANPFIVEAELWDNANNLSYAIHHTGDEVVCQRYEVKAEDRNNRDNKEAVFLSHRMDGRGLCFLEYWEPRRDIDVLDVNGKPDDEKMPTLVMTHRAFIGFTPLINKEDRV